MFIFWENPDNIFVMYVLYPICVILIYVIVALVVAKIILGTTPMCKSKVRLFGKTAIVTGGNAGIGKETALDFARRGARVILACRNEARGRTAAKEITESTGNYNVECRHLNLSDLNSVRKFAEDINHSESRLDILVNNAGINEAAYIPDGQKTVQNFDLIFGTNHVGHFLLTYLLLDLLKLSSPARIVNVSSYVQKFVWKPLNFDRQPNKMGKIYPNLCGYSISKLANVMHARELSKRLKGTGVTINSLHPGLVNSQIWIPFQYKLPAWLYKIYIWFLRYLCLNSQAGAQTSIYVSVEQEIQSVTGEYFVKNSKASVNKLALDDRACLKLWDVCLDMCGLQS